MPEPRSEHALEHEIDSLDRVLRTHAPQVTAESARGAAEIRRMSQEARRAVRPRRRGPRVIAAAAASILLLGGGVTAAAAAMNWHWWAEEPDALFTVTAPSGERCEYRVGNWQGATPQAQESVRTFAAEHDIAALADIDGALAALNAEERVIEDADGVEHPAGPGTDWYNPDADYHLAVGIAVSELLNEQLRSEGIYSFYAAGLQSECSG